MNFGHMSSDSRAALPTATTAWQGIGTNVNGFTANINRLTKPRWYDRLLGYGLNGAVIYRNVNPATNLTVKGAQGLVSPVVGLCGPITPLFRSCLHASSPWLPAAMHAGGQSCPAANMSSLAD